jgi:hypothetical protein
MNRSIRLTTGQALVRFIPRQYAERDGKEDRFIQGIWAVFGHGNVAGLDQGIAEFGPSEGLRFTGLPLFFSGVSRGSLRRGWRNFTSGPAFAKPSAKDCARRLQPGTNFHRFL